LYIYDVSSKALETFVSEVGNDNVVIAKSAKEVAEKADTIVTMLPEGSHVKSVYLDKEKGLLAAKPASGSSKKLFIDSSTIDTESSVEVGQAVKDSHVGDFADCPVSGGVMGAEAATLSFMIGCPSDSPLLEKIRPVLSCMGKPERLFTCGPAGSGLGAKLSNNYLAGVTNLATAEAMNLGVRLGLDAKTLAQIIHVSTGQCFICDKNNPIKGVSPGAPAERDFQGGFRTSLLKKDITLARAAGKSVGAKMPLADTAIATYQATVDDPKCEGRDCSVVYRHLGGIEK